MNDAPHEQIRHFQSPRLDSVRRQVDARLAAGHHVLLFGPPSGGKSFLVDRILASGRLGPTIEADAGHDSDSALVSSVAPSWATASLKSSIAPSQVSMPTLASPRPSRASARISGWLLAEPSAELKAASASANSFFLMATRPVPMVPRS